MSKRKQPSKGFGSAYKRGARWWITYMHRGERVREPGGLDGKGARTKTEAEAKLHKRIGELETDTYVGPEAERLTVASLVADYLQHLEGAGKKSVPQVRCSVAPVLEALGHERAAFLKTARLREYRAERLDGDSAPATVNRGLQALRAAFNLARKEERLQRIPFFPLLPEDNRRKGFFEREEHDAIRAKLPEAHGDVAQFGYRTGWRLGEILPLRWSNVDRAAGEVRLADSKNGEPRIVPLRDDDGQLNEVGELIEQRWTARKHGTPDSPAVSVFVFHVRGHRLWDFNRRWREASKAAELPHRLFHDYRRTAARDLVRAGVPETVAMGITGHKTRAVFERYNITSSADKRAALSRLSDYRGRQRSNVAQMGRR